MAEIIKQLEFQFLEIGRSLDGVTSKLDGGFRQKYEAYGFQEQVAGSVSPQQLMQRVSQVEKQFQNLLNELHTVEEEEKAAVEFLKQSLTSSVQKLKSAGDQVAFEKLSSLDHIETLLGIELPRPEVVRLPATDKLSTVACVEEDSLNHCDDSADQIDYIKAVSQVQALQDQGGQKTTMPSNACRRYTNSLVEIDEAEYNTLSDFTKQRVKLSEVNMVYKQLWRHFKEEHNTLPISTSEMFRKGIRVTGKTGQTKLRILQALKLISLSSKGDVKLL